MSKPRYIWWSYVKGMIRRYPEIAKKYAELHSPSSITNYSGVPGNSRTSRITEALAIRELPTTEQREYEAVRRAVETTERYHNGRERLQVIQLVLWDKSHTLAGAALTIPCSERSARRWNSDFIYLTASFYGLMDENEFCCHK